MADSVDPLQPADRSTCASSSSGSGSRVKPRLHLFDLLWTYSVVARAVKFGCISLGIVLGFKNFQSICKVLKCFKIFIY